MKHSQTIMVPKHQVAEVQRVCDEPPGSDCEQATPIFTWTAKFPNGLQADVKVVSDSEPEEQPCWCEAVLFNEKGYELVCTEPSDTPWDEWSFMYEGDEYVVNVQAEG